ncbi:MAG: zinc ABC transporter substrate-binding protein [Rhizobiaceae bacterium]|jgi:zinc/manganese transport system substrate-binding protein|nr:zinc ABC transporter substrate-binding protein [Rhizobiaceae bacterium]
MLFRTHLATLALAASASALLAFSARAEGKLDVVASFSIIADFAQNVGGDRIALTTLVGPNGDAHVYEPKPSDAVAVAGADVVLVNGLEFEGFLPRLLEAAGTKAPIIELTKGGEVLKPEEDGGHSHGAEAKQADGHDHAGHDHSHDHAGHDHGEYDPHAWQSVHNAETYVNNIADAFCAADAAGCDVFKANAAAYVEKLEALEAEIKSTVSAIPEEKRIVITAHDAFGYFEHEYGIDFIAPEGVSTEAEASAKDVAAIIGQIKEQRASAVFLENITDPRLIEQIAADTGVKVGGTLFSDALTDASGAAPTYLEMMRHNINTIKAAIIGS